jgi:hypothetical protein
VEIAERTKVERYLRMRFNSKALALKPKGKSKDSAEVYIGDEFIGTITRDDEDGDLSYHLTMTILDIDLEG